MADSAGRAGSTLAPKVVLAFAILNLLFLVTEIAINVLGATLPL